MIRTWLTLVRACLVVAAVGLAPDAPAQSSPEAGGVAPEAAVPAGPVSWPLGIVELAEALPVQDGGRIKPLHTFAGFTLLRLSGRRSLPMADGDRRSAMEWLLDVLLFPELAEQQPVFLVENPDVLAAIDVPVDGHDRRDRYTLSELRPGMLRLFDLAHEYGRVDSSQRSPVQAQLLRLAGNVDLFLGLRGNLGGLAFVPPVASAPGSEAGSSTAVTSAAEPARAWLTPVELWTRASAGDELPPPHAEIVERLTALTAERDDPRRVEEELAAIHGIVSALADGRDEAASVGLELIYYKAGLLRWSLALFVLAFVTVSILWMRPRAALLFRAAAFLVLAATALLGAAIVLRCMIRGRPPVSTLYETVLFVTVVGAALALVIELIRPRRIALSAAALLGMVGLFIANGYETLDGQDTMPSLVAVLDTNFWLATHVTAITIGYSAGMLAALLGSIFLIARLLRGQNGDRGLQRELGRMIYGVVAFALIFSLVGTILGGIWANESWGRFWGWDPKENGALLICISQVAILHARRGGYLRDLGVAMAAAFGGTIIAFSWWGVNLLGVGLHSYGFTSGIHGALWTYYAIQWGVMGLGGVAWLRDRGALPLVRAVRLRRAIRRRRGRGRHVSGPGPRISGAA